MAKTNRDGSRRVSVALTPSGSDSELLCRDGEVAESSGVAWLEALQSGSGSQGSGGSGGSGSGDEEGDKRLRVDVSNPEFTLPAGAEMLGFVGSPTDYRRRDLLFRRQDGTVTVWRDCREYTSADIGSIPGSTLGELKGVLVHDGIMTLLGSKRTVWIVRSRSDGVYTLRTALPAAPECKPGLAEVSLPPYVSAEGDDAMLSLSVEAGSGVTVEAVASWIEEGRVGGVPLSLRETVAEGAAEAVAGYLDAVESAGLTTSPLQCVASWSGRLPGEVKRAGNYSRPVLVIESWTLEDGVLRMSLRLTAPPYRPYADVIVRSDNVLWSDLFERMEIYLASGVKWWESAPGSGVRAGDVVSVSYERDGVIRRGRGIRLFALDEQAYSAASEGKRDFRLAGSVSARSAVNGVIRLRRSSSGEIFTPDYRDHTAPLADGGAVTDEGVVLYSGCDVMSGDSRFPVLFPRSVRVGELPLQGLSVAFRRRSATVGGKTPLLAFSGDGVRLLGSDGDGGYGVSQLLSRDILSSPGGFTATDTSVIFSTSRGLVEISGSRRSLLESEGESGASGAHLLRGLHYHYNGDFVVADIVLEGMGKMRAFDRQRGVWSDVDASLRGLTESGGELFGLDASCGLCSLSWRRERVEAPERSKPALTGRLTTRALKLGDWQVRKSITGMATGCGDVSWQIEGSDTLADWEPMASGSGSFSGRLRLPSRRFWRLLFAGRLESLRAVSLRVRDR